MHVANKNIKQVNMCDYYLGESKLDVSIKEKYLGVYLTYNLNWNAHVDTVTTKAYRTSGVIRRVFGTSSKTVKKKLLKQFIWPKMDHASTVGILIYFDNKEN